MPLTDYAPIAFVPTNHAKAARGFYEQTLGLRFISNDQFAMAFRLGNGTMLRVVRVGEFTSAPFTIFGWEVRSIEITVAELSAQLIELLRYGFMEQDDL